MKKVLAAAVIILISFACHKSKNCEGPDLDCSSIRCIAHWYYFDFKLVDKTTGVDIVFGSNPKYTTSDIKLFFDAARTNAIALTADNANKKFSTMTAKSEMYLEIKGTDVYKLTAEFRDNDCCSSSIKVLWQDGAMICSCCNDVIPIGVN